MKEEEDISSKNLLFARKQHLEMLKAVLGDNYPGIDEIADKYMIRDALGVVQYTEAELLELAKTDEAFGPIKREELPIKREELPIRRIKLRDE